MLDSKKSVSFAQSNHSLSSILLSISLLLDLSSHWQVKQSMYRSFKNSNLSMTYHMSKCEQCYLIWLRKSIYLTSTSLEPRLSVESHPKINKCWNISRVRIWGTIQTCPASTSHQAMLRIRTRALCLSLSSIARMPWLWMNKSGMIRVTKLLWLGPIYQSSNWRPKLSTSWTWKVAVLSMSKI